VLIYLDMCSIHRPLDDKSQLRILVEADAVLVIVSLCESGQAKLVSSDALEYEARRKTHPDRAAYAFQVLGRARRFVPLSAEIEDQARALHQAGLKPLDALHLASAIEAGSDYFCT
jgi:predicted nucleic acid-binding protein